MKEKASSSSPPDRKRQPWPRKIVPDLVSPLSKYNWWRCSQILQHLYSVGEGRCSGGAYQRRRDPRTSSTLVTSSVRSVAPRRRWLRSQEEKAAKRALVRGERVLAAGSIIMRNAGAAGLGRRGREWIIRPMARQSAGVGVGCCWRLGICGTGARRPPTLPPAQGIISRRVNLCSS